ncbi:LPXTG cell wall anchor domain-containing protein [Streptomyces sp. NPDC050600]|uniref:LPXTG cell wall anchor domain-containing protein n=1 Tax=Streptomyces sp. NPDC050600 TaxID=3157213 RepID=UPI003435EB9E
MTAPDADPAGESREESPEELGDGVWAEPREGLSDHLAGRDEAPVDTSPADEPAPADPAAAPQTPQAPEAPQTPRASQSRAVTPPELTLEGVPATFEAGGDWQEISAVIVNSGGELVDWELDLAVNTDGLYLSQDDVQVQVWCDGAWRDAQLDSPPEMSDMDLLLLEHLSFPKGTTTIPVRIRAGKNAPLTEFYLGPRVGDYARNQSDPAYWVRSEIVAPRGGGEEPGEGGQGGEEPGGAGQGEGERPGDDGQSEEDPAGGGAGPEGQDADDHPREQGGGTAALPAPTPGNAASTPAADRIPTGGHASLAATGSDAASSWTLGIGGVSVALGAGLVAAARKRRRPALRAKD